MRSFLLACAVISTFTVSNSFAADETIEPPLKLTLEVDGKPFPIELGREQKLTGDFRNPTVVLRAAPTREFTYGGIAFDYPSNFSWEAEIQNEAYKSWTLSGNDSKILYFSFGDEVTPDVFASALAQQYGEEKTKITDFSRTFGKQKFAGKRVIANIAGITLVQDVLIVPAPAKRWRILILQNVAPEVSPRGGEPKKVLELLSKTLVVEK